MNAYKKIQFKQNYGKIKQKRSSVNRISKKKQKTKQKQTKNNKLSILNKKKVSKSGFRTLVE